MKKLTSDLICKIVCAADSEVEKEFRKGSTFYATAEYVVIEDDIEWLNKCFDIDLTPYIGMSFQASGLWSDDDGLDLYSGEVYKKVGVKVIPEEVIVKPAYEVPIWEKVELN